MATRKESSLAAIKSAKLSPTEHSILCHFVEGATDPDHAADYLHSIISDPEAGTEIQLRKFKQDWRRLVNLCMSAQFGMGHTYY